MPRMTPIELCIANLRGDFPERAIGYQPKQEALAELKRRTGQDFGFDFAKWVAWLRENPETVPDKAKTVSDAVRLARGLKQPEQKAATRRDRGRAKKRAGP